MMLVDVPGRQKANSRLRNVVYNRKLAWFAYYFYRERTMVSQRPDHPLTNRRKTGGKAEPFSKRFWKILLAPQFVRLILLYGQIGPDRKNMAIMQDWPVLLWKIAKMQDEIRTRKACSDPQQNNANHRTTSKILRSDLGTCWRSKCPAPPCQRHRQIVVHVSDKRIPSFSQVYYGQNRKKQANGMTVPFQKTWHRPSDILRATICRSKLCGYWYHPLL